MNIEQTRATRHQHIAALVDTLNKLEDDGNLEYAGIIRRQLEDLGYPQVPLRSEIRLLYNDSTGGWYHGIQEWQGGWVGGEPCSKGYYSEARARAELPFTATMMQCRTYEEVEACDAYHKSMADARRLMEYMTPRDRAVASLESIERAVKRALAVRS